jgi:hypothetical protein
MLGRFMVAITAFFTAFLTRSAEQKTLLVSIVDYLKKLKLWTANVGTAIADLTSRVGSIDTVLGSFKSTMETLSTVKGNYDALPYNWGADTDPNKPVDGVGADTLLTYVLGRLGKAVVNGKSFQIQLSGDESLKINVNGVVENGNPNEAIFCVVNDFGGISYVYQADPYAEQFEGIAAKSDEAKASIEADASVYVTMTTDMNLLSTSELPTISAIPALSTTV